MRPARILLILAGAAVAGLGVFALLAARAVTVETADPSEALQRFSTVRASLGNAPAMVARDTSGRLERQLPAPATSTPSPITVIHVLAYRTANDRIIAADVPFWFFRLKAPAAQYLVRDTGFDLAELGLTAADLAEHGPGLVLDEQRDSGDRVLIWTE
jgi:hypothetical protein